MLTRRRARLAPLRAPGARFRAAATRGAAAAPTALRLRPPRTTQATVALQGADASTEAGRCTFAETKASRPASIAPGAHAPLVAPATVFVAAGAPWRATLQRGTVPLLAPWCERPLTPSPAAAAPAEDCPFADVVDALLPHLDAIGAGAEAAVQPLQPGWASLFQRRGRGKGRAEAATAPPAYAWLPGLCPAPPVVRRTRSPRTPSDAAPTAAGGEADDASLLAWAAALRGAGSLVLVLPPWADEPPHGAAFAFVSAPSALRSARCLAALLAARAEGVRVTLLLPPRATAWLERAVRNGGYPALRHSVTAAVDSAAALETADAGTRAYVARLGGAAAADAAARAAASMGLLDAACVLLLRRDDAPLASHLRAGAGVAAAARPLAEHCASVGRLRPAERLLRIALSALRTRGINAPAIAHDDEADAELAVLADLAAVLQAQGQLTEAQKVLHGAVDRARLLRGPKHARTRAAEAQLEQVQQAAGELCVRHFARIAYGTRS